jgi:hypothetical protein
VGSSRTADVLRSDELCWQQVEGCGSQSSLPYQATLSDIKDKAYTKTPGVGGKVFSNLS